MSAESRGFAFPTDHSGSGPLFPHGGNPSDARRRIEVRGGAEIGGESKRQDIQEIINYRRALQTAEGELRKRLNLLLQLHRILLDSVRGRNKARGLFRTEQNWIGPPGSTIEEARFVPPAPCSLKSISITGKNTTTGRS